MFQRVRTAYQHIARSLKKTSAPRQSVRLHVVSLEERATPATTSILLAPIDPPNGMLMVVVAPPPVAPAHQVLASDTSVRSDLFGVGETEPPVDELEEMLASEQSARKDIVNEPATPRQESTEADAGGAVIVEDLVFVPRVD